jgi:hypothetical protein
VASEDQGTSGKMAPEGVGESIGRRGEDIAKHEKEEGRYSTGSDGTPADRPTGESTPRDVSALNDDEK